MANTEAKTQKDAKAPTRLLPPEPNVGDTVLVTFADKNFEGIVIAKKGKGISRTFTVRKIATGKVGVERIFPLHSPLLTDIQVKRQGRVRRAKLYYLRGRTGRAASKVKTR